MSYAPIVLFVYNRPEHTIRTLNSLSKNHLFPKSKLFIYCDGSKSDEDSKNVKQVQKIVENYDFPNRPEIIKRDINYGLSKNIISGISETINLANKVIVIEDDIVTSANFLNFMNNALTRFESNKDVWHISGWNYPLNIAKLNVAHEAFFWKVMNCWGWGTWKDKWKYYDKDSEKLIKNWSKSKITSFNLNNRFNFWKQVEENHKGLIDTWAIFWMSTIFENNGYCLNPLYSYVNNIGHDNSGENSRISKKFNSNLAMNNINKWPNVHDDFSIVINEICTQNFKRNKYDILKNIKQYFTK